MLRRPENIFFAKGKTFLSLDWNVGKQHLLLEDLGLHQFVLLQGVQEEQNLLAVIEKVCSRVDENAKPELNCEFEDHQGNQKFVKEFLLGVEIREGLEIPDLLHSVGPLEEEIGVSHEELSIELLK